MLRQPFSVRLVQDLRFQAQAAWAKAISKGSEELGLQVYRFEGLGDLGLRDEESRALGGLGFRVPGLVPVWGSS